MGLKSLLSLWLGFSSNCGLSSWAGVCYRSQVSPSVFINGLSCGNLFFDWTLAYDDQMLCDFEKNQQILLLGYEDWSTLLIWSVPGLFHASAFWDWEYQQDHDQRIFRKEGQRRRHITLSLFVWFMIFYWQPLLSDPVNLT